MENSEHKFTCQHCGETYEAYPPDDFHRRATIKKFENQDDEDEQIEMKHKCTKCKTMNTLFWS